MFATVSTPFFAAMLVSTRTKPRAILTRELAVEIYRYKIENMDALASAVGQQASKMAGKYGVCEKTIRDIWTARTWSDETLFLEPTRRVKIGDKMKFSRSRIDRKSDPEDERPEQVVQHDREGRRRKESN